MYKLVISDDEGKTTVVPLVRDEITIGRKEGNTIRLTERNVSRKHARLRKANGAFVLEDLGSYNGIKINGRKIGDPYELKTGDQINIGDYMLALQLDAAETVSESTAPVTPPASAEAATAMIPTPSEQPAPPARLVMLSPPAPGAEFALSKPAVRFGRAEDLDAWVNHRSISREHAEVRHDDGGFKIVDLGSANGLRVNGQETRETPFGPGDVIEMGQVRFRFVAPGEVYTFDADRTIQMEAIPDEGGLKVPLIGAAAIVLIAAVIGGVFALSGGDEEEEPIVTAIEDDPATAGTDIGSSGSGSGDTPSAAFQAALDDCQEALADGDFASAVSFGSTALDHAPGDEAARECKVEAEQRQAEHERYQAGIQLLDDGELDEAILEFQELDEDSDYLDEDRVQRAYDEYIREHLREARSAKQRSRASAVLREVRALQAVTSTAARSARWATSRPGRRTPRRPSPGPTRASGRASSSNSSSSSPRTRGSRPPDPRAGAAGTRSRSASRRATTPGASSTASAPVPGTAASGRPSSRPTARRATRVRPSASCRTTSGGARARRPTATARSSTPTASASTEPSPAGGRRPPSAPAEGQRPVVDGFFWPW